MRNRCAITTVEKCIYTILLGLIGSFSHFAYKLSGNNPIVGLFNPINESIWEHLKIVFYPFLLWWVIMYFLKFRKHEIHINSIIVSAAISLVIAPLAVVSMYYSYTGALGIESLVIDIIIMLLSYFVSLSVAAHFLKYSKPNIWVTISSITITVIIFAMFVIFTFNTPNLPIFLSGN